MNVDIREYFLQDSFVGGEVSSPPLRGNGNPNYQAEEVVYFFLSSSTGSERWTRSTISILASPDKGLKYMPVLPRSENTDRFGSTLKNKVVIAGKKPAPETDEPQNGFPELEMGNSHYR
ncbi:hypothetical protein CIHG_07086 [Coccidioides immitis H538.4]|uniref:Uncharacterized protein n=1 Tax=Coccidioides immitis H538.4 TaxID=396776 RepID=A0A0J8RY98_COCIT|nr:hypothetical protein CIHG_07086 [Coccidioides immitis H538.4]